MRKLRNNILLACCLWTATATAQIDSIPDRIFESEEVFAADSLIGEGILKGVRVKKKRDWASWRPETKRAMWLSIVLPGAGQIYNRKYWKLPIIYGGFVGCAYAMRWNNQMYHDYSQAYMDLMDDDPKTESYNQFMHLGAKITDANITRYQELFRKRKDRYRRWRDMSFFVMVGIYAMSVVDAYVAASLSEFDISDDLSLEVSPAVMGNPAATNPYKPTGIGLQCSLTFSKRNKLIFKR
ncbi:MAG: hypothetical protein IKZ83_03295, partial [Prevotella sp.]|nr:hypothetical protein [Prevotella sp.]